MKYHTIHSNIWDDEKVKGLSIEATHLFIYLFSNNKCTFSGIYKISPEFIGFETRLPNVKNLLTELCQAGLIAYDFKKSAVWVRGKLKHHKNTFHSYGTTKSILNDLEEFRGCSFLESLTAMYPELLDLSITLERLRKQRYKQEPKSVECNTTVSESVSVIVSPPSRG